MRSLDAPDAKAQNVDKYHTYEGGLGVTDNEQAIAVLNAVKLSKKGVVNGIAALDKDGKIPQSVIPNDDIVQVSVIGLISVYYNATNQYTISNYDMFTSYEISPISGSVVRIKDTIIYTAPSSGTVAGFWINGRRFNITLTQSRPETPTVDAPVEAGIINTSSYTFISSSYNVLGEPGAHASTDWELSTLPTFSSTNASSINDTVNKTSWAVTGLIPSSRYYVRVRYKAANGNYSNWSATRTFDVVIPVPATPTITFPTNTGIPLSFTASSSAMGTLSDGSTHLRSDWQIATDAGFTNIVRQTAADTVNKNTWPVSGLSVNTPYFIRVVYMATNGQLSQWSTPVQFTTINEFTLTRVISTSVLNFNIRAEAIASGWDQVTPLNATVTINSGVVVGSASTGTYAFDTGTSFPASSTLNLINNGYIVGAGGSGGRGGYGVNPGTASGVAGSAGGPAIRAQHATNVTNNGIIGGGGGGAGGGGFGSAQGNNTAAGGGGGGGAGYDTGLGGVCISYAGIQGVSGTNGTYNTAGSGGTNTGDGGAGGNGGALGSPGGAGLSPYYNGGAGGAAGPAVIGNSNVTWNVTGTRLGALQ